MQIHELTKRQKTNEGLLDTMRDGIAAVKTGFKQGGLAGAAKASVSNYALNQATSQRLQKNSEKGLDSMRNRKDPATRINAKTPLSFYMDQAKKDPASTQQRQSLDSEFSKDFDLGPVLPDPGYALVVEIGGNQYFKDISGKWYAGDGSAVPPNNTKALEDLIDQDQYSQTVAPSFMSPPMTAKGKSTVKEAAPRVLPGQLAQRAQQRNAQPAVTTRPTASGALAQRAQQRNASAVQPAANAQTKLTLAGVPGTADTELQKAVPGTPEYAKLQQQLAQEPNKAAIPGEPLTPVAKATGQRPARIRNKKKLRTDFNAWIAQELPSYHEIANDRDVDRELKKIFNDLLAYKSNAKLAVQLFDKYVLTIQGGILRAKAGAQGPDNQPAQADDSIENDLARLRGQPAKKTGNQELDYILSQAGIKLSEAEQKLYAEYKNYLKLND